MQSDANGRGGQASVILVKEQENGERKGKTLSISVPGIAEGTIDRPGDVDRYAFKVERGQQVAFEVETPQVGPPQFNPRFGILDEEGRELFSNVYKRLGRQLTFYLKTVEPKTLYTFERSGEYSLVVSDLTRRFGNAGFRYRLLLRPQIPHVGEVRTDTDRLNLVVGQASKIDRDHRPGGGVLGRHRPGAGGTSRGCGVLSGHRGEGLPGPGTGGRVQDTVCPHERER